MKVLGVGDIVGMLERRIPCLLFFLLDCVSFMRSILFKCMRGIRQNGSLNEDGYFTRYHDYDDQTQEDHCPSTGVQTISGVQ